ncbi:hypothetical protein Ancab_001681 [Ancistrocladus abbreviatus]
MIEARTVKGGERKITRGSPSNAEERKWQFGPLQGHRSYKDVVTDFSREVEGKQGFATKIKNDGKQESLKVVARGKLWKGAFMEDIRASAEKLEKGTPSGNTVATQTLPKFLQGGGSRPSSEDGVPNIIRVGMDLEKSEPSGIKEKHVEPIKGARPSNEGFRRQAQHCWA